MKRLGLVSGWIAFAITAYLSMSQRSEPCDWDGEAYCIDCKPSRIRPATHERLGGMLFDQPTTDMVCCYHAKDRGLSRLRSYSKEARRGDQRQQHG